LYINYNSYILRKITGFQGEYLTVEKDISIKKLIERLSIKHGTKFKDLVLDEENKRLKMIIIVNGRSIYSINHKISDKDNVKILSIITGG